MLVNIKKIKNGKIPEYKTNGSAGADCFARLCNSILVRSKEIETIPLGFAVELPEGFEMQIRGRSGLARKNNIEVFNSPGTIDSDYRGEVCAILYNNSDEDFVVNPNDRIAQAIIAPIIRAQFIEVKELNETERGSGGFGSTGVSENKVEKFYEPFTKINEAEKYLDKKVLIDNVKLGKLVKISENGDYIKKALYFEFKLEGQFERERITSTSAFQRVTVDGHRFGKEIK